MGFGGISVGSLLVILLIVLLVFGTKRLRNISSDLGNALKNFRKGLQGDADDRSSSSKRSKQKRTKTQQ